ncbi:FAD-dependent oxidoreductase [Salinibacterium sp. ZJ77]|uniref:FAD-dependent oxidoreductase n=1 Tax=Salinibacterium sp. ZJ77 TaxID=2708337 RepID=UPI0014207C9B|nr:FAD-dependent oxidoreductase [Salinibacterium sp. ZJ77]
MIARIDRALGRIPMYLLVIAGLTTLGALALALSIAGALAFSPLALLASAAVLLATSWIANEVLARIVRTRPHAPSWIITALLLAFVLEPTLTLDGMLGLAFAAAIAAASKYVLAWRGRHLANPAAVGALAAGLLGVAFPSWWIGTGLLLPLVALFALAILHRTRHLPMGLVYVLVGGAVTTSLMLAFGLDVGTALSFAFASSPLVFAAGFMLSEPLTLPPRRWQRLLVAVVAALLATVPFTLGPLHATPELGLVVAGVIGFAFGQRRGLRLELVDSRMLTPTAWEFRFRARRPLRVEPGQYLEITVPHARPDSAGTRRVFSVASVDGDELTIGVRIRDDASSFKRALRALAPGARVHATGVWGDFTLPRRPEARLAFVAAGIGVTPFIAHLRHLAAAGRAGDAVLVYAVRSAAELAYRDEIAASGCAVVLLCPEDPGPLPDRWVWAGASELTADVVRSAIPDVTERTVLLSGAPNDVARLRRELRAVGVRRVRTDVFLGY